jgi:hypothetical protein
MAKATHAQEVATGTSDSFTEHELNDPVLVRVTRPEIGYVDRVPEEKEESPSQNNPADSTDSSPSAKNDPSPIESNTADDPKPALTTENPSQVTEQEDSSANSMGGDGQRTHPRQSSKRTPAKKAAPANPRAARVRSTDDEFGDDF